MTINTVTATPDLIKQCIKLQLNNPNIRNSASYIWGEPGIGKSEIINQVAKECDWELIDLRLTRMDSTDLTGLPFLHEESKQTIYYLPEFLPTEEMISRWKKKGAIIFLDELSAAEPRLQAAAYELILDRRIGKYELPTNVMVIAAGNRVEDGAIAYDLTSALSDRFIHYVCLASPQSWIQWADDNNIHSSVKSFIQARPDFLTKGFKGVTNTPNDDKINPSPRSWKRVSDLMWHIDDDQLLKVMVPGIVGSASSVEFFSVVEEISSLAPMSEYIRLGLKKDSKSLVDLLPNKIAGLFGLGYSLPAYCQSEDDFVGACYVLNELANIEDDLPRKEILCSGIITLFTRAQEIDSSMAKAIHKAPAYRIMRKQHLAAFAEIEDM